MEKNVASLTTCVAAQKYEHNDIWGDLRKVYTNPMAANYQHKFLKNE